MCHEDSCAFTQSSGYRCKRSLCSALRRTGINHLFRTIEHHAKKSRFGAAWEKVVAHHQHTLMLNDYGELKNLTI
jgi:hypothetical protein